MENNSVQNNENKSESMEDLTEMENEDDYLVKSIGAFGIWQAGVCIIASSMRYTAMTNMFSIVFLTPSTDFICTEFEINKTINIEKSVCYSDCLKYEYDNQVFEETLTSEFDLICERMWMEGFTQTMLIFGFLFGVSLFGWISDRFGRRKAFLISSLFNTLFMIAAPFSPSYWIFTTLRFLVGLASGGVMIVGIVYILETVGPQYREIAGTLTLLPDGLSEASLSVIAYYSPGWRIFLLGYSIISMGMAFLVLFLPETPRWLFSKGKFDDAIEIMYTAAKRNNLSTDRIRENIRNGLEEIESTHYSNIGLTYVDLFKTKKMALRTISSIIIWTTAGFCFFGINQYVTFLGTDIFISVMLLGLIQAPILPFAIILNKIFGRKLCLIGSFLTTTISMTSIIFIEHGHWLCTIVALTGLAATCTAFAVLYVYVSELFPTPLRNMAYGLSSAGAKIGAMVAPFVALLTPQWIPSMVFAIVPVVAVLVCIFLPETVLCDDCPEVEDSKITSWSCRSTRGQEAPLHGQALTHGSRQDGGRRRHCTIARIPVQTPEN